MDNDGVPDDLTGLPQQYSFTVGAGGNNGIKTFPIRLRKAGARMLRVEENVTQSPAGTLNVTVQPAGAEKIQLIADYDPAGEQPAPGKMAPSGFEGRTGAPRSKLAGSPVSYLVQVVDHYWNLSLSSAASVMVSDTDPNNAACAPVNPVVFTGSTTVTCTLVSASVDGARKAQVDNYALNESNPSSVITVTGQPADRLLALFPGETRVQGKTAAPAGKTTPAAMDFQAGSITTVTVVGVDQYYNTDTSAGLLVTGNVFSDPNDVTPAALNLVGGTTRFFFVPVTASTHNVIVQSASLPALTSTYVTPNPVTVWWSKPEKLQVLAAGQKASPGAQPYDQDPTTGGRAADLPSALTAGVTTQITVNLVDRYFNVVKGTTPFLPQSVLPVSSYTAAIEMRFPNDTNIQLRGLAPALYQKALVAGTTNFSVIPVTRNGSFQVKVVNALAGTTFYSDTVAGIAVGPNTAIGLQLLVPPETALEGSPTGKTGATPGPLVAGTPYTVTVNAVDLYNNLANEGATWR